MSDLVYENGAETDDILALSYIMDLHTNACGDNARMGAGEPRHSL